MPIRGFGGFCERIIICVFIVALAASVGCKTFRSSDDPLARDQEIIRDIKWRLSQDARFDDVLVACQARVVTLSGCVPSREASAEAVRIADETRDVARVLNHLDVREK